jgi:PST family polysaccharide transporter
LDATVATEGPSDRAALKSASVNGVAITFSFQMLRFGLQFIYQILIARLLVPADFGIVAMAAPILAFIALFADFGLTQATVQRPNITQQQLSLIFWATCLLSICLAVVTIAAAPAIAAFYNEPRVGPVFMALGSTFFISGLYAQHLALLNRRLQFLKLALVDLLSFLIGAVVGIGAALLGMSYWAIVLNQLTVNLVSLALAWSFARWMPGRPRLADDTRALLGFGGNITTFNFVNYFARNLDNVLIGKYVGDVGLGLYDRAYKLLLLPLSQITTPFAKVATPLLAKLQVDPPAYRRAYLQMLITVCVLTYPGVAFAMITSHQLIVTLLGAKWAGVAPIFSVLAIGGFFAPISNSTGWLFITQDRTREMRNWGVVSSAMFVVSFVIGLHWGPLGVASCYIFVGMFQGPMVWWAATRSGPLALRALLAGLAPSALALVLTILVEAVVQQMLPATLWRLVLLGALAYPVFLAGLALTAGGRATTRDTLHHAGGMAARVLRRR